MTSHRNIRRVPLTIVLAVAWILAAAAERSFAYGTGGDISIFKTVDGTAVDVGFGILDEFDSFYEFFDPNDNVFDNILVPHTPTALPPIPWTFASNEPGFDAFFGTLPPLKKLTANLLELKYWNGVGAPNFAPAV